MDGLEGPTQKDIYQTLSETSEESSIVVVDNQSGRAIVVKPLPAVAEHGTRSNRWTLGGQPS